MKFDLQAKKPVLLIPTNQHCIQDESHPMIIWMNLWSRPLFLLDYAQNHTVPALDRNGSSPHVCLLCTFIERSHNTTKKMANKEKSNKYIHTLSHDSSVRLHPGEEAQSHLWKILLHNHCRRLHQHRYCCHLILDTNIIGVFVNVIFSTFS